MVPFFPASERLASGPTLRRYFGIENDHFTGAAFCPGSPERRLTVALLDWEGKIAGMGVANHPCRRAEFDQNCGFCIPIPLAWARNPDGHPRFSFRIMETGLEFPEGGRSFSPPRAMTRDAPMANLEAKTVLARLHKAAHDITASSRPWLLVTHETHRTGAPLIALSIARWIAGTYSATPLTLCLGEDGALSGEFAALGPVVANLGILENGDDALIRQLKRELAVLRKRCHPRALVNSLCSAPLVPELAAAGFEVVSLVHEYPFAFSDRAARGMLDHSAELVFPCEDVRGEFARRFAHPSVPACVRPQGVVSPVVTAEAAEAWKQEIGVPPGARVVLACGTADLRKGFDWFCDFALGFLRHSPLAASTHFVWLGKCADEALVFHATLPLRLAGLDSHVHLAGERADPSAIIAAADVFLMCSRIDPFPNVVLEALALGIPVVGFDHGQGCAGLLQESGFGTVVPAGDQVASRAAIEYYLRDDGLREEIRRLAPAWIRAKFPVDGYASSIAGHLGLGEPEAPVATPAARDEQPENTLSDFPWWKSTITGRIHGLRAAIASGKEPVSWPMPWGTLEFLRADVVAPQLEDIIRDEHYRVAGSPPIRRIVDGGANIGVSALWFAAAYPEASVEAYEADPELALICRRNLEAAGQTRVSVIPAALWIHDGNIPFAASGDDRGHIDLEHKASSVPCLDIAGLMEGGVDLLKLDIEGAEIECLERLLESGAIQGVRHLVAEVHLGRDNALRTYRVLAGLAEAGFATAFDASIRDWLGPETTTSPFPGVGRDRTFMLLRAWQTIAS